MQRAITHIATNRINYASTNNTRVIINTLYITYQHRNATYLLTRFAGERGALRAREVLGLIQLPTLGINTRPSDELYPVRMPQFLSSNTSTWSSTCSTSSTCSRSRRDNLSLRIRLSAVSFSATTAATCRRLHLTLQCLIRVIIAIVFIKLPPRTIISSSSPCSSSCSVFVQNSISRCSTGVVATAVGLGACSTHVECVLFHGVISQCLVRVINRLHNRDSLWHTAFLVQSLRRLGANKCVNLECVLHGLVQGASRVADHVFAQRATEEGKRDLGAFPGGSRESFHAAQVHGVAAIKKNGGSLTYAGVVADAAVRVCIGP